MGVNKLTGGWRITGIEKVEANINKELAKIKLKSSAGLVMAASEVLVDADKTPPLVPVDFGPLRESTHVDPPYKTPEGDPYVVFGYSANYAAAVHEMMQSPSGKPINWSRPGSGPKFFEASLKRNKKKILRIIKEANQ